jgi:outer membrane protein assembly factor BamE (lipoprotein component of BamABCDE complex)
MRRKRLQVVAGIVLVGVVLLGTARLRRSEDPRLTRGRLINQKHCDRIKAGMSQAEVEAILGGPPGDFTTGPVFYSSTGSCSFGDGRTRQETWSTDDGQIVVDFNERGVVQSTTFNSGLMPPPRTLAELVRDCLRSLGF